MLVYWIVCLAVLDVFGLNIVIQLAGDCCTIIIFLFCDHCFGLFGQKSYFFDQPFSVFAGFGTVLLFLVPSTAFEEERNSVYICGIYSKFDDGCFEQYPTNEHQKIIRITYWKGGSLYCSSWGLFWINETIYMHVSLKYVSF